MDAPYRPISPILRGPNGPGIFAQILAIVFAMLAVASGGCVKKQSAPDIALVRQQQSGVVAVATALDGDSAHVTLCSGALVAPNLVLTARHCVSRALTSTPSCDSTGRSHNGAHVSDDADPAAISVYIGDRVRLGQDSPRAHAIRTLHPSGSVLCDADVAFLVLDRPITEARVLPIRLHGSVESGDLVVPVGFGGGPSYGIGNRVAHERSTVLAIGPTSNSETGAVLGPREFEVDSATCRGDSGGPAIDARTGEVVGVVSRGGSCFTSGNHVYTRVNAYTRLAAAAFNAAVEADIAAANDRARRTE
jgi:hypothetical protein